VAASLFARGAERIYRRSLRTLVTKRRMSEMGQNAKYSSRVDVFRFALESGNCAAHAAFPFRANRRQLRRPHSEFDLTNDDDVANRNGGLGPIRNDDLDHRDGPTRALG
jgi:hypothetical protein